MKTIIAAALLAASSASSAQYINGNKLHRDTTGGPQDISFSMGYITGVADAYDGELFCLPPAVNVGQMTDVVRKFIIDNPKHRHLNAAAIVSVALSDVWPCKAKKGGT